MSNSMVSSQSAENHLLSVIIPVFKQEQTIKQNILRIKEVMDQLRYDYEIIVVIDGFVDKSYKRAKIVKSPKIKVVGYPQNRGKGHALRFGMARAKGDIVAFIDSGTDLNPNGLSMLLEHFEWYNADIIVGSKWHPASKVQYPFWRKSLSLGYGLFVHLLFGLHVKDTQLGMKFFRRKVLEKVLPRLLVKKYAIDIELLAVANKLGFTRIYEAPIELDWKDVDSAVSKDIPNAIWNMIVDTLGVFYRLKILRYYDDASKRKWVYDPELDFRINVP